MDGILTITITSLTTLIVTVLASIAVERLKIRKAKIMYSITESIPINLDDKKMSANIVRVENVSSKTVKDVVIRINDDNSNLKLSGISSTDGMELTVSENISELSILIPFLKQNDHLHLTVISEGEFHISKKPDMSIRSPDLVSLVYEGVENEKFKALIIPSVVAAIIVALTLAIYNFQNAPWRRGWQSSTLAVAASVVGLPKIAEKYTFTNDVYYYNQSPYIYALAKQSNEKKVVILYRDFLVETLIITKSMSDSSKSAMQFFIGKIELLLENESKANDWLDKSKATHNEEYDTLVNIFEREKPLTKH